MDRDSGGAGHRHPRLQGILKDELNALFRDDVSDPSLYALRVRAVVLSVDYRHARVHFTVPPGPTNEAQLHKALGRATPFLRARLVDAIDLKRAPDLRFVFDGFVDDDVEDDARKEDDPWSA
jgi:ribosome-binding factor A